MFSLKFFLLTLFILLITIIYFFSSFSQELPVEIKEEVITIEPILIPSNVQKSNEEETLLSLKHAVDEASYNDNPSAEEEALEVLKNLETHLPLVVSKPIVVKKKEVVVILQPDSKVKKTIKEEKKIEKKKVLVVKKQVIQSLSKQKSKPKSATLTPPVSEVKAITLVVKNRVEKQVVFLGEHNDLHTLSKEETEHFKHLEIISESKPFRLEEIEEIKNPLVKTVDISTAPRSIF